MTDFIAYLTKSISNKYLKEKYFTFGIESVNFNLDEHRPNLHIAVRHYKEESQEIEVFFESIYSYNIMSESFIYFNDDEKWEEFAFVSMLKSSHYENYVRNSSLLNSHLEITEVEKIFHFRVSGQNFYIDVLTKDYPKISVKEVEKKS